MRRLEDYVGFDSVLAIGKVDELAYLQITWIHSGISGLDGVNRCLIPISNGPECIARFNRYLISICRDSASRHEWNYEEPTYSENKTDEWKNAHPGANSTEKSKMT